MELEYAYAKFQSLAAEEVYVRHIPARLGRKLNLDEKEDTFPHSIGLTKCQEIQQDHCLLYYSLSKKKFAVMAFHKMFVDNQEVKIYEKTKQLYEEIKNATNLTVFDKYEDKCDIPHVHFFILPDKEIQKSESLYMKPTALLSVSQNMSNPRNKIHDKVLYSKWSNEDREALKRQILLYGYGRWKQYQTSTGTSGGRLMEKPKTDIRAFANSFIRSLAEDTGNDNQDLKQFLYSIVEEYSDDPYVSPNSKDWEIQNLKQRAVPYTKRLQLLYRIKVLIKRFKEDQLKNGITKPKIVWDNLLNFLPNSALYGQRPNAWWTKRHDTVLLRGVYKYGYANYQTIRQAPEYGFQELEKTNSYSNFPSSDALTRRLKKLISTIIKSEQDKGQIDFDNSASSQDEEKGWSHLEKRTLFDYLVNWGVPLNTEGRSNWLEIREEIKLLKNFENFDKSISQIEKMVQKIRLQCQELIVQHDLNGDDGKQSEPKQLIIKKEETNGTVYFLNIKDAMEEEKQEEFIIGFEQAVLFNKNTNMLQFIRKTILSNQNQFFYQCLDEFEKNLPQDHPAYIKHPEYISKIHDLQLLNLVSKKGFRGIENEQNLHEINIHDKNLTTEKLIYRIDFISQLFKEFKDRQQPKKRKNDKDFKDMPRKKQKLEINRDIDGNIIYPIVVSTSLKILNLGTINYKQAGFHSEQNLFPVGYVSIRTHASMITKGGRCEYTCEILEGDAGKPNFRVTCEEDPSHSIVRESCSGCWLFVCEKVNQLSDHKKDKVTVSGPDRFGISQSQVAELLEDLPNADKCYRYKFKTKDKRMDMEDDNN